MSSSARITELDLKLAVAKLSTCKFFPTDEMTRGAIQMQLAQMCPHPEALNWLTDQFTRRIGAWHGPVELRAVLSMRFRPLDQREGDAEPFSELPGYTPMDAEARQLDAHAQLTAGGTTGDPELSGLISATVARKKLA